MPRKLKREAVVLELHVIAGMEEQRARVLKHAAEVARVGSREEVIRALEPLYKLEVGVRLTQVLRHLRGYDPLRSSP